MRFSYDSSGPGTRCMGKCLGRRLAARLKLGTWWLTGALAESSALMTVRLAGLAEL
jgi:hypothetical protein